MASLGDVSQRLKKTYERLGTWRAVGEVYRISGGMAFRIALQGYEPKDLKIRSRLGLTSMAPAPVCAKCGKVHVSKRCTARPALWMRKVWDTPEAELRWRLENREEY